ncbi:MAG: S24 family peptidase [Candidatus Competibacteraceae bacterium]
MKKRSSPSSVLARNLKLCRESLGLTQKDMAARMGCGEPTWQNYEYGKTMPGGEVFVRLAEMGVNMNWLFRDDGPMFLYPLIQRQVVEHFMSWSQRQVPNSMAESDRIALFARCYNERRLEDAIPDGIYRAIPQVQPEELRAWLREPAPLPEAPVLREPTKPYLLSDELLLVPRYSGDRASSREAATGREPHWTQLVMPQSWLQGTGLQGSDLAFVVVSGDSMEPTLRAGDLLLVDTSHRRVMEDAIYAIIRAGLVCAKRLQRWQDGSILIRSDNPSYAEERVAAGALDRLEVVGKVVWRGHWL